MRALVVNCTLKTSPERSNTGALAEVVATALRDEEVEVEELRIVDHSIPPWGESDPSGDDDEWALIRERILDAQILIFATPTWLGGPSSVAQRALERMDSMLDDEDDGGLPVAYNRVAGIVVTGSENGVHDVISEIAGALIDIGFTVPGQAWAYWNRGSGDSDLESKNGHEWPHSTGRTAAANLLATARALTVHPLPSPPPRPLAAPSTR